jgi:hypothetical protein
MIVLKIILFLVWLLGWIITSGYLLSTLEDYETSDPEMFIPLISISCIWPIWIPFALSMKIWKIFIK